MCAVIVRCDVRDDEGCESCQQDCTCSEGDWYGLVKSSIPGFVEAYMFDEGNNVRESMILTIGFVSEVDNTTGKPPNKLDWKTRDEPPQQLTSESKRKKKLLPIA